MLVFVCVDAAKTVFETDLLAESESNASTAIYGAMQIFTLVAIGIYILDISVRIYIERLAFWRNAYNTLDFVVVLIYVAFWITSIAMPTYAVYSSLRILRGSWQHDARNQHTGG
nr:hypothetical protein HK105_004006 [Polyrhizophydium stewartii]